MNFCLFQFATFEKIRSLEFLHRLKNILHGRESFERAAWRSVTSVAIWGVVGKKGIR